MRDIPTRKGAPIVGSVHGYAFPDGTIRGTVFPRVKMASSS